MATYVKKEHQIEAVQFNSADDVWPAGVTKSGRRYYFTPWAGDGDYKRVIPDGNYLLTCPDGERVVMDPEEFEALYELDV